MATTLRCASNSALSPTAYSHHLFHSRHEFYETDERLTLTIFDRGADPVNVNVELQPRSVGLSTQNRQTINADNSYGRFRMRTVTKN